MTFANGAATTLLPDDSDAIDKWSAQLRKGTLELAVLAALAGRCLYGLELLKLLGEQPFTAISEGTLYPLLDRLKREQLVKAEWVQQGEQRPRKYYHLTTVGQQRLQQLQQNWRQAVADLDMLLQQSAKAIVATQEK